eukprot:Rmarinus@m.684
MCCPTFVLLLQLRLLESKPHWFPRVVVPCFLFLPFILSRQTVWPLSLSSFYLLCFYALWMRVWVHGSCTCMHQNQNKCESVCVRACGKNIHVIFEYISIIYVMSVVFYVVCACVKYFPHVHTAFPLSLIEEVLANKRRHLSPSVCNSPQFLFYLFVCFHFFLSSFVGANAMYNHDDNDI